MNRPTLPNGFYDAILYVGATFLVLGIAFYIFAEEVQPLIAAILTGPALIYISITHKRNR